MKQELRNLLHNAGTLDNHKLELGYVDTGSYALNRIISGKYDGGYPIGGITELIGEPSVGKTGFLTHAFKAAQKKDYICGLVDVEFAYSESFAAQLGVDSANLVYFPIEKIDTAPKAFQEMEAFIKSVRAIDEDTPIVLALDSLGTIQSERDAEEDMVDGSNMDGAIRAKEIGRLLRKFNPVVRANKVCLLVVNQWRVKPGGIPGGAISKTRAGGGRAAEYYLSVSLDIVSNKSTDINKEEKNPVGFKGKIVNKKNKVSVPYLETVFDFNYTTGLDRYYGLAPMLAKDGIITQAGAWYELGEGKKFRGAELKEKLATGGPEFDVIRDLLNLSVEEAVA